MLSPSVFKSATSILPSSTVPVISPTAQVGCMRKILVGVHEVADGAAERDDAAVEMAGRVDAVGEQRPGAAAGKVDPEARTGEAGVADGLGGALVAARPALV